MYKHKIGYIPLESRVSHKHQRSSRMFIFQSIHRPWFVNKRICAVKSPSGLPILRQLTPGADDPEPPPTPRAQVRLSPHVF